MLTTKNQEMQTASKLSTWL